MTETTIGDIIRLNHRKLGGVSPRDVNRLLRLMGNTSISELATRDVDQVTTLVNEECGNDISSAEIAAALLKLIERKTHKASRRDVARSDTAEFVRLVLQGLGFVQFTVVDAQKTHNLTVVNDVSGAYHERTRHLLWAEATQEFCDAAAPFCRGNAKIVRFTKGRIEIRIPDPDTASSLLRFTRAFYASPIRTVKEFAAKYQP
jgi:hypothetical protein